MAPLRRSGRRSPLDLDGIHWLIGAASGPSARRLDLSWALELAAACDRTSTAFFMKQLGTVLGQDLVLATGRR